MKDQLREQIDYSRSRLKELEESLLNANSDALKTSIYQGIRIIKMNLRKLSYELLFDIGVIQGILGDSKIEIIDYSTTFDITESMDYDWFKIIGEKTDYKDVMLCYISSADSRYKEHISNIKNQISRRSIFNLNDVVIKDFKKPSYLIEIQKAERELKKFGLIKNNKTTDLLLLVKKIYSSNDEVKGYKEFIELLNSITKDNYDGLFKKEILQFHLNQKDVIRNLKTALEQDLDL